MARKKQQHTIRLDYLENWIGFYKAHGQQEKAEALMKIAWDVGALIEAEEVERWESIHSGHVAWRDAQPGM